MKKAMLLAVAAVLAASLAHAQAGRIGIFSDTQGINCAVADSSAGLMSVFVVHIGADSWTASQFSATKPACMTASFLSDTNIFPVSVGGSQTGIAIGYGACLSGPVHVLTINYFGTGTTPPCCIYTVGPDSGIPSGKIEIVDCQNNLLFGVGQSGVVNADATCPCSAIVPVEESSWGAIKALYGDQ